MKQTQKQILEIQLSRFLSGWGRLLKFRPNPFFSLHLLSVYMQVHEFEISGITYV